MSHRKEHYYFLFIVILLLTVLLPNLVSSQTGTTTQGQETIGVKPKIATQKGPADPLPGIQNKTLYQVLHVVDGDTLDVNIDGQKKRIRLIGVNTPETVDPRKPVQCFGPEASAKAKEILSKKSIYLQNDPSQGDQDKYGRLLRYVFLDDGTDFNQWLIANGYGFEYTYNKPYLYQSQFKNSQQNAQKNGLGLWSEKTCAGKI